MNRFKKIIISILCIAVVLSGTAASAAENDLPPGILIGDRNGIQVDKNGDYYINAVDLRPGDVIRKTLTINNAYEASAFRLSMTAEPMQSSGPVDLLDAVHLELRLSGKEIYSGRIRGDEGINMIQNALELGTYSFGDSASMNITLSVDKNIEITKEKSEADIGWHFFAVREEDSGSPKTGETARNLMILLTAILLGGSGVLLAIKKRQAKCE